MKAADVMTTRVVAVRPTMPGSAIARLLLANGISAAPVVNDDGVPLGMVSEGDLMPRDESERAARRDWWLRLLAEGEDISGDFLRYMERNERTAEQMMSTPVISVDESADLLEVAKLLDAHRIKRVPVLREGRVVGIISRADLIKAAVRRAASREPEPPPEQGNEHMVFSDRLAALPSASRKEAAPCETRPSAEMSAENFRRLAHAHEHDEEMRRAETHRQAEERRHEEARKILAGKLTEEAWQHLLSEARHAAAAGEEEVLVLRFPTEVCSDHGRAINAPDPNWPETLRGLAAQLFMRWKTELRPLGFALHARVIDFPDGVPGEIGLYLAWGK